MEKWHTFQLVSPPINMTRPCGKEFSPDFAQWVNLQDQERIIADGGYQEMGQRHLLPYTLNNTNQRQLTPEQRSWNQPHRFYQKKVENVFGDLKTIFNIFSKTIRHRYYRVDNLIGIGFMLMEWNDFYRERRREREQQQFRQLPNINNLFN